MHRPAAADGGLERPVVRQPVMDGEEHVLALWRELIGHLRFPALPAPGVRQQAQGFEARDRARGGVLARAHGAGGRGFVGETLVVEMQLDAAAHAQLELARGEPGGALLRFGEVGPDALDGPGQQALEADGGGFDQGGAFGHGLLLGLGFREDLRAASMASSARSAASSLSRRLVQNARVSRIHCVRSSNGLGSSARKWSRPEMRRRTSPARSRRRMCLDTELSEMPNGAATSVTRASPAASRLRMLRRVSSRSMLMAEVMFTQKD